MCKGKTYKHIFLERVYTADELYIMLDTILTYKMFFQPLPKNTNMYLQKQHHSDCHSYIYGNKSNTLCKTHTVFLFI